MTTMLALDPGGTTGWSLWHYDAITPARLVEHGQIEGGLHGFIAWASSTYDMVDEVVSELFLLDGRTARPDTTPLQIEGAIEAIFGKCGKNVPIIWQPNTMKAHITDGFLKDRDLWKPGQQHSRDSMRHALASLKVRRHGPTIVRYWARKEEV